MQVKNIKISNIGNSSIEYQWKSKNIPKSNPNAVKDPKDKFKQHCQSNVILPGEEAIFSFSFFSEIPGIFV